jgi:hypothetical protein
VREKLSALTSLRPPRRWVTEQLPIFRALKHRIGWPDAVAGNLPLDM